MIRYAAMFGLGLAYVGTSNGSAVRRLLHSGVSDLSDDVRRAAVISLGFVLCNAPNHVSCFAGFICWNMPRNLTSFIPFEFLLIFLVLTGSPCCVASCGFIQSLRSICCGSGCRDWLFWKFIGGSCGSVATHDS